MGGTHSQMAAKAKERYRRYFSIKTSLGVLSTISPLSRKSAWKIVRGGVLSYHPSVIVLYSYTRYPKSTPPGCRPSRTLDRDGGRLATTPRERAGKWGTWGGLRGTKTRDRSKSPDKPSSHCTVRLLDELNCCEGLINFTSVRDRLLSGPTLLPFSAWYHIYCCGKSVYLVRITRTYKR